MPEDQGQNGDLWTAEASTLLTSLGWDKVADSNIDIEGTDGQKHGIDSLFRYTDALRQNMEGVFVEAKRYRTSSFAKTKVPDWVERLYEKMIQLRRSEEFNLRYPAMAQTNPRNGLLALWFHDLENYRKFRPVLAESMLAVQTTRRRATGYPYRLFVLENDGILRLCSLLQVVREWNQQNRADSDPSAQLRFFYPSSLGFGHASQSTECLNIEYIFSSFVLAKSRQRVPQFRSACRHRCSLLLRTTQYAEFSESQRSFALASVSFVQPEAES